jgi:hypothetical protein
MKLNLLAVAAIVGSTLLISACGGSSTSAPPSSAAEASAAAAPAGGGSEVATIFSDMFAGTYKGTWKNSTLGTSGMAAADITVDKAGGKVTFKLTLTGGDFGGTSLAPETFILKFNDTAAKASGTSATFGKYELGITYVNYSKSGAIQMQCDAVPGPKVESFVMQGEVTKTKLDLLYQVYFKDSSAFPGQGTVALTK